MSNLSISQNVDALILSTIAHINFVEPLLIDQEWRDVVGYEGKYRVSEYGHVESVERIPVRRDGRQVVIPRRLLTTTINNNGYHVVKLSDPFQQMNTCWLVAEAWHCTRPAGMHACHNDGNPSNNHYSNIRWDTPSQNRADALIHGTTHTLLKYFEVVFVRLMFQRDMSNYDIADIVGVDHRHISEIRSGKRWGLIPPHDETHDRVVEYSTEYRRRERERARANTEKLKIAGKYRAPGRPVKS